MTTSYRLRAASVILPVAVCLCAACSDDTGPENRLRMVIGDIEGSSAFCPDPPGFTTLATANSINTGALATAQADTWPNLLDVTGAVTTVAFAFDTGGQGFGVVFCGRGGDAQEDDGVSANGPVLHKRWSLAGLTPGAAYTMTFTAGGRGAPRRAGRIFVDADGDGSIEAGEVADLIGLDGIVETRPFPQTIIAGPTGQILGEWWGGSTNLSGENGAFEGWTVISAP